MKNSNLVRLFTLSVSVLLFYSCEKAEFPQPDQTGIPFGLTGDLDGSKFKVSLDQPGYKMHTFTNYNDTLWTFGGALRPAALSGTNQPELEIIFRNKEFGRDSIIDQASFLNLNWHFFNPDLKRIFHPLAINLSNAEAFDNVYIELNNKLAVHGKKDHTFLLDSKEDVSLYVRYGNSNGIGLFTVPRIGDAPNVNLNKIANWKIKSQSSQPRTAVIIPYFNTQNQIIKDAQWGMNDTTIELSIKEPGQYSVTLTDEQGVTYKHSKPLFWNSNDSRYMTFGEQIEVRSKWENVVEVFDKYQRASVFVRIKNSRGEWFNSNIPQLQPDKIEILEVKRFINNERGNPTLALKVRLNCRLRSESNNKMIHLRDFEGWIAIALPGL
jgi:hypothetical protein